MLLCVAFPEASRHSMLIVTTPYAATASQPMPVTVLSIRPVLHSDNPLPLWPQSQAWCGVTVFSIPGVLVQKSQQIWLWWSSVAAFSLLTPIYFCQPVWAELVVVICFRGGSVLTHMSSPTTKDAVWELLKRTRKKRERERERGFVYKWYDCEWEVFGTCVKEERKLPTSERWCDHIAYLSIDVDMSGYPGPEVRLS